MTAASSGPSHQIWGKAELPSEGTSMTSFSCGSAESSLEPRPLKEGDPRASKKDAPSGCDRRTYRKMHPDVQRHMRDIQFNEESRTDDEFAEHSSEEGTDEARSGCAGGTGSSAGSAIKVHEATTAKLAACSIAVRDHWSKGSDAHHSGQCRPCHYLQTKLGCMNGVNCEYCHLSHAKKSRPRPCKAKRTQCKRIVGMLDTVFAADPNQFAQAAEMLSTKSPYMRTVIRSRMKQQEGEDGEPGDKDAGGAADAFDDEENDRTNIASL